MVQRTKEELVPILFRYFMAASLMSQEFYKHLGDPKDTTPHGGDPRAFMISKAGLKMCLWYGMLYVVVEGWNESGLLDPEVDRLLASPNTKLLRRFRNGMFHFQTDHWLPGKFSEFFDPQNKTVEWVRALTAELRRCLMEEMKKISCKPTQSTP
jgi:hypothetical protein